MFLELFKKLDIELYSPRQKIEIMEWYLKNKISPDLLKVAHHYDYEHILHDGWYVRKMFIPAGDLVIGMVHKTAHMNYILQGKASVMSDHFMLTESDPLMFESLPETKKVVFAHTDVVYATTHKTNKTDLDEIMRDTVYESDLSWIKEVA